MHLLTQYVYKNETNFEKKKSVFFGVIYNPGNYFVIPVIILRILYRLKYACFRKVQPPNSISFPYFYFACGALTAVIERYDILCYNPV